LLKGILYRKLFGRENMPKEEYTGEYRKPEQEKKPTWTMDVMILSNLNEISKSIDEAAMQVETGNLNEVVTWKAGLKQFYRNIRSFFASDIDQIAVNTFNVLDSMINVAQRSLPSSEADMNKVIMLLANLNEMFYHARNELFMRLVEVWSPTRKAYDYAFSALPDKDKEARIAKAEKKVKEEEKVEDRVNE
jgi:hypothetical protein